MVFPLSSIQRTIRAARRRTVKIAGCAVTMPNNKPSLDALDLASAPGLASV
jgi:hypothetical protein